MEATETEDYTYEKLYFSLWEIGQRYGAFARFRVIGKSHDDRMIPMLEIGEGQICIFCLAGVYGSDRLMPEYLTHMAEEYCQSYECDWIMDENYRVRHLLDQVRICFVPLLNPDGYEICGNGYSVIRNPIFRQMLRMQNYPYAEFFCNARGIDLTRNFPTSYYMRGRIHQEPASENETKALIHIMQEYKSAGLLSFGLSEKKIIYCRKDKGFSYNQKSYRMAKHLQKRSTYSLEKGRLREDCSAHSGESGSGSPEQFYAEVMKQPSLMIETPLFSGRVKNQDQQRRKEYREICLLPLEYIYSLAFVGERALERV